MSHKIETLVSKYKYFSKCALTTEIEERRLASLRTDLEIELERIELQKEMIKEALNG